MMARMQRDYTPIAAQPMRAGAIVRQPALDPAPPITDDDPALSVMTDLARVPAVLVDPEVDIEAAMRIMIRRNVRSLFVANVDTEILGSSPRPTCLARSRCSTSSNTAAAVATSACAS